MGNNLNRFRQIVDRLQDNVYVSGQQENEVHPFDTRNIHPEISRHSIKLFNDGHFSQATFEAYKYLEKRIKKTSGQSAHGLSLMMAVFNEDNPIIKINDLLNNSEKDEQRGYKFLFSGGMAAIRNMRGHEVGVIDPIDLCLDHLSFASMLSRKLDQAIGAIV